MRSCALVALLCLLSCRRPPAPLESRIGIVVHKGDRTCLDLPPAPAGMLVSIITLNPPQSALFTKTGAACVEAPPTSIGILDYHGQFKKEGGLVTADLDDDGKPEYFRYCLSSEGVHYTIWTGQPLTGQRRWHKYEQLGYDVEPTCKEVEWR